MHGSFFNTMYVCSDNSDSFTLVSLGPDDPSTVIPTDREKALCMPQDNEASHPSIPVQSTIQSISSGMMKKGSESGVLYDSSEMMMVLLSPAMKPFRNVFPEDTYKPEVNPYIYNYV